MKERRLFISGKKILGPVITALFLYLINTGTYAQEENYLIILGIAEKNESPLVGATVNLYEKSSLVRTVNTGLEGDFEFRLRLNSEFIIEVTKEGMYGKKIAIDTEIPEGEERIWKKVFSISLYETCEGMNASVLNEPVTRIIYNKKSNDFQDDEAYLTKGRARIGDFLYSLQDCLDAKYREVLNEADKKLKNKDYLEAKEIYKEALRQRPDDPYPQRQLDKIEKAMAQDKEKEKLYQQAVMLGDRHFNNKNYEQAKEYYKTAASYKSEESYPRNKLDEIDRLISRQKEEEVTQQAEQARYYQLLSQANSYFNSGDYEKAKELYDEIIRTRPNDALPKSRLTVINNILSEKDQADAEARKKSELYNQTIIEADRFFEQKNYALAKTNYQRALQIKPAETYPQSRLHDIENIEKQYTDAINEGDRQFGIKNYAAAKSSFQNALNIKPDDPYAKSKINEADRMLANLQNKENQKMALEESYRNTIQTADNLFNLKEYQQAKQSYQKALTYKPNEAYPKTKVQEIDQILLKNAQKAAAQKITDDSYKKAIDRADGLFKIGEYNPAKVAYLNANRLKPDEPYPKSKIAEIDNILMNQQQEATRKASDERKYQDAIANADRLFNVKQYSTAKGYYEEAAALKPAEAYPKSKIAEINQILEAQSQAIAQAKQNEEYYNRTIANADNLFQRKEYVTAKSEYQKALTFKPAEQYPKTKIQEIDQIFAEQRRQRESQRLLDEKYQQIIADADRLFKLENYNESKVQYQSALSVKPSESYPKTRIAEIDRIMAQKQQADAELKNKTAAYNDLISKGDAYLRQKEYQQSKTAYQQALSYFPGKDYPKNKIKEIDDILARLERERLEKERVDREYNQIIARADSYFDRADYNNAKQEYLNALKVKPEEPYPKQKLARIAEINRLLATEKQKSQSSSQTSKPKPKSKLADLKFNNNSEREAYLKGLLKKYPEGVSLEVYMEERRTVNRFVIIRRGEANEFREIKYNWGGVEYFVNDKPITSQYFRQQTKQREGEYYHKVEY